MKITISDDVTIELAPGSRLAGLAALSSFECNRALVDLFTAAKAACSTSDDWAARHLEPSSKAWIDADEAYVAYFTWCTELRVLREDRLSYVDFGAALVARGFEAAQDDLGRVMHLGCRLRETPADLVVSLPAMRVTAALDEFLASECIVGRNGAEGWTRASEIHAAYAEWAQKAGRPRATTRVIKHRLIARGIDQKRSNGVRYGLRLRSNSAPDLFGPRAPDTFDGGSGAEYEASKRANKAS